MALPSGNCRADLSLTLAGGGSGRVEHPCSSRVRRSTLYARLSIVGGSLGAGDRVTAQTVSVPEETWDGMALRDLHACTLCPAPILDDKGMSRPASQSTSSERAVARIRLMRSREEKCLRWSALRDAIPGPLGGDPREVASRGLAAGSGRRDSSSTGVEGVR